MCPAQERLWTKVYWKCERKSNLNLYFPSSKNSNFKLYNSLFCVKLGARELTWNLFFCRNEIVKCVWWFLLWFVTRTVAENILSSLSSIDTWDAQELSKAYSFNVGNTLSVRAASIHSLSARWMSWGWQLLSKYTQTKKEKSLTLSIKNIVYHRIHGQSTHSLDLKRENEKSNQWKWNQCNW